MGAWWRKEEICDLGVVWNVTIQQVMETMQSHVFEQKRHNILF